MSLPLIMRLIVQQVQAGILKAGAVRIEFLLKAKHALVLVMMGASAAQIFTFLESLSKKRS